MERKLLNAFLRYEEVKGYIERLDELRENDELDDDQYVASKEEYEKELEEARSAIADIRLQIKDAAEAKRTEFEIYEQELKNLEMRMNTGELTANQYIKERDRAAGIVTQAEDEFNMMRDFLAARSSEELREVITPGGASGGGKLPLAGRRQRFFTVGRVIALVASVLVILSPFLPFVNIPDIGGISLVNVSSELGHPIWAYPLVYGLFALAFILPPPRALRGAMHFLMVVFVVILIVIAIQAGRAEAEAQFYDASAGEMGFESFQDILAMAGRMTFSIIGVGAIAFLLGLLGILAAGAIELCRGAAGVAAVVIISCLTALGSAGHLTFWFEVLRPAPVVNVRVTDRKNSDGTVNARRAAITIANAGSRALRLWGAQSKCKKAPIDYALRFQKFNEEDGEWEDQSPRQTMDIGLLADKRSAFVLPVAIRPGEQRELTMTFSPIWDPHGRDGRGSMAGKYRICLVGMRRRLQPNDFTIKSVPGPNDVAERELAKARAALERGDLDAGALLLKRIPRGSLRQREISDECVAVEELREIEVERKRSQAEHELKALQTKIERLIARHAGAAVAPQAERLLRDVKTQIKDIREEKAKRLLAEATRLYDRAEQSQAMKDYDDAVRGYERSTQRCDDVLTELSDTPSESEARRLKRECGKKILEVQAAKTLTEAKRLIDRRSYIVAGTLLCREYHRDVKRGEFQEQIARINKWAEGLTYEELASEFRMSGDPGKAARYKKLSEAAQTDFNLKIVNMFNSARNGRVRKGAALKIFREFLEEYPQSKRAADVAEYIRELGGEAPRITKERLFSLRW